MMMRTSGFHRAAAEVGAVAAVVVEAVVGIIMAGAGVMGMAQVYQGFCTAKSAAQAPDFARQQLIYQQWSAVNCPGVCHRSPEATEAAYGAGVWQWRNQPKPETPLVDAYSSGVGDVVSGGMSLTFEVYVVGRAVGSFSTGVIEGGASTSSPNSNISSRTFVTTPNGTTIEIPAGWIGREANNGKGIVFQRPGASGNADMIRIMEPTERYPNGYVRYYNSYGQPLDVTGRPGPPSTTHIPIDYQGTLPKWPH